MTRFDYARNSYCNEFISFPPSTSYRASRRFFHGPNHCSYGFGLWENSFVLRCFGYGPHPHRGERLPRRNGFSAGGSYTCFEPKHLDGPHFLRRGSCPTGSNCVVQKTIKTS
jgi:hypothetical protein